MIARYSRAARTTNPNYTQIKKGASVLVTQWVGPVFAVAALLIVWYWLRLWLRNIRRLTDAIVDLQRGLNAGYEKLSDSGVCGRLDLTWHVTALGYLARQYEDSVLNLMQADALRRKMIVSMTQDLRAPLTTVQGYLQTMQFKAGVLTAEQNERFLAIAIKNCYRLNRLVDEFHELSKLDCPEAQPDRTLFSLSELAQHVIQKYAAAALERGIALGIAGHSLRHVIAADVGMIERVIANLIDNALRFTARGGEVTVKLKEYRTKVKVQVSDTGRGMRQEDLLQLFNGAFRTASRDGAVKKSTGVGLLIVKRILDLHGCEIKIDSELGVGTTFCFYLPLAQAHAGE